MPTISDLNAKYSTAPTPTRTPAPEPGFFSKVGTGIKQGLTASVTQPYQLAKGIVTGFGKMAGQVGVANPVRAVQSLPETVKGITEYAQGNKLAAEKDYIGSSAIQNATLGNLPTNMGQTVSQNFGSAAQWASLLVPGTKLGTIAQSALAGGLFQGGTEATNPNATGTSIVENTALGAGLGTAAAGATEGFSNLMDRTPKTPEPTDVTSLRTRDVTPDYESVIKKEGITPPKIQAPLEEPGIKINRVNESAGTFGKRTVNSSSHEAAIGAELSNIKNYPDQGTHLQKAQSVQDAIINEAEGLKSQLQTEDKAAPLSTKAKDIVTKNVLENMTRQAREVVRTRGKGIEGDALDRAGTVQGRYAQDVADELNNYDGSRAGILELRKNLDSVYEDAKGKTAFASDHRNALDEMHTQIRDYLNKEVNDSTKSVAVQTSLEKQSKLFRAKDVLDVKAEKEATSYYGRLTQNHPALKRASNILARQGIMVPLRVLEALAGLTVLTAGATKFAKKLSGQ